jgi:hypothetical protein
MGNKKISDYHVVLESYRDDLDVSVMKYVKRGWIPKVE